MSDKILTLHPAGKQGVNIDRNKYETIKAALLDIVEQHPGISFADLAARMSATLDGRFDGSVVWYTTTVKLDLEARGLIVRRANTSPQQLYRGAPSDDSRTP